MCGYCDVYRRQKQQQKAAAAVITLSVTSSSSDVTDATRVCDRRLAGSASASALGYFEPATFDDSGESSSTSSAQNVTSLTPTTSSSITVPSHSADLSPDDERQRQILHRSSPLTALNSIYVNDHHVTGNTLSTCAYGGGVVNDGFVSDGILTDSWRRVSWRARLRAGIARSTISSDPGPSTSYRVSDVRSHARRPSYLSDVIDSVTFFSNASGSANAPAHCELPLTNVKVARCESDGGEWTLSHDHDRHTGYRPPSLVSSRQRTSDHTRRHVYAADTYYTYAKDIHRNDTRTDEPSSAFNIARR